MDDVNSPPVNSRRPPPVNSGVRCLYCGSGTPWWDCLCAPAAEVRDGKRPKPKIIYRDGRMVIVLDDEAAAFNALGLDRWRPLAPEVAARADVAYQDSVVNAVTMDRREYRREWMRKWREEQAKKRGGS